jgi:protocatechuate 3,4-dioxygenase beta subunit
MLFAVIAALLFRQHGASTSSEASEDTARGLTAAREPRSVLQAASIPPPQPAVDETAQEAAATLQPEPAASAVEPEGDLGDAASLDVTVRDDRGRPWSGVRVGLDPGCGTIEEVTQRDGTARFRGLLPDVYSLELAGAGLPQLFSTLSISLEPREFQAVELVVPRHESTIAGRVVDTEGAPLTGVRVRAQRVYEPEIHADERWISTAGAEATSSADGTFRVDGLPEGKHLLLAEAPEGIFRSGTICEAGETAAEIVLEREKPRPGG